MGCDYYTWIETVIEYRDASGVLMTYIDKPEFEDYERHYDYSSYDPDLEEKPDPLSDRIARYGKQALFNNGAWICKEHGKQRILAVCEKQKILADGLLSVFKRMGGYWR